MANWRERSSWRRTNLVAGAGALMLLASWALAQAPEALTAARQRFAMWQKHPGQLARLRANWDAYLELPEARRAQLAALDEKLHAQSSAQQAALYHAMDAYADWLEKLPAADRDVIRAAPDRAARLARIRELRERDWLQTQPRAVRDTFADLGAADQVAFVKKRKRDEARRQAEWRVVNAYWRELEARTPLPYRLADLPSETQTYVSEYLRPALSLNEKERLARSEGLWPGFMMTLVDLAERHPPALPSAEGPRTFAELPAAVRSKFKVANLPKQLKGVEGRTAVEFAEKLSQFALEKTSTLPNELWAYHPRCLHEPMKRFLKERLEPVLDKDESLRYLHSHERWPEFPLTINELARVHNLQPPWFVLPGPREKWEGYRSRLPPPVQGIPEVPKLKLREFLAYGLDAGERQQLRLGHPDAQSLQRLTEAYFAHYPAERKLLLQANQQAYARKP